MSSVPETQTPVREVGVGHGAPQSRRISLVALANVFLRRRAGIAVTTALFALGASVPTLFAKRTYTATASFVVQDRRVSGVAQGLAAQLGLLNGSSDAANSPAFYLELLKSPEILGAIAESSVRTTGSTRDSTLIERYGGDDPSFGVRRKHAIEHLSDIIKAQVSPTTSIITVSVTARSPGLAAWILQSLLSRLNEFNLARRQSQAAAEKDFAEARLTEANNDLRAAEDRLQAFLEFNKVRTAPELTLQEDRLRRAIEMRQQLYTSLAESYQSAKLEQARDIPLISIIDPVGIPPAPDPRGFTKRFLLGFFGGLVVALFFVFVKEYLSAASIDDVAARDEFHYLLADTKASLRVWPLRRFSQRN